MYEKLVFPEKGLDIFPVRDAIRNQLPIGKSFEKQGPVQPELVDKVACRFSFCHPQADPIGKAPIESPAGKAPADPAQRQTPDRQAQAELNQRLRHQGMNELSRAGLEETFLHLHHVKQPADLVELPRGQAVRYARPAGKGIGRIETVRIETVLRALVEPVASCGNGRKQRICAVFLKFQACFPSEPARRTGRKDGLSWQAQKRLPPGSMLAQIVREPEGGSGSVQEVVAALARQIGTFHPAAGFGNLSVEIL